jgi:uncharacterized cupredoxin-like copper-binding protein
MRMPNEPAEECTMRPAIAFIAACSLALAALAARAHGDEKPHAKASAAISPKAHAFGRQGDPKKATRTIAVGMSDQMRFTPSEITVTRGETVTFVVANKGQVLHEMVIGTEAELLEHARMMREHPGMHHDEPYMAHVKAGGKERLTWQFTQPGAFMFACLIPGHFEAGMKGRIVVKVKP